MEMAALVDIEPKVIKKINKLFDEAILIDNMILRKLKSQIDPVRENKQNESHSWDTSITAMFNPRIDSLFSYELPEDFILRNGEMFHF